MEEAIEWSQVTPEYRRQQFAALVVELHTTSELNEACAELVNSNRDAAEGLYDATDEALASDDEEGTEGEELPDEE